MDNLALEIGKWATLNGIVFLALSVAVFYNAKKEKAKNVAVGVGIIASIGWSIGTFLWFTGR